MKMRCSKAFWLRLVVGAGVCLLGWAQVAETNKFPRFRNTVTNTVPQLPPAAGSLRSPVELFRELLAMNPGERNQALSNRPPENRKLILAKVREYESLDPNQRELRLQATDLRWYLWPLMNSSATNRSEQVAHIPEGMRELIRVRLEAWDNLSNGVQRELVTNEATLRFFT